ncbi:sarcosine oxidase subunit alpha family protein [Granulosicoccus antarcticus]|uniref:Sarcosine oxidase subunit alpha n=1 Tax=Granulosicoccus antarcticus IMCC3135 TaxID=1192854 RepID=A0A2Z2NWD6_9GAMM|nr:sarcosine oxidase subunit alpha family protein [Granulosicoccus antarcticus]ASJ75659.1 Sarcosine oxidase subunit alpha [Granulosicoccus antarcticus IMCC3135]
MSPSPAEPNRIGNGLLDPLKSISFQFNKTHYTGLEGDTLASALLANGQRLVGRSFKYHRPRGIFTSGPEEPNALVELGVGAHREPNTRATVTELYQGLEAHSQNHRGPLSFDVMAINDKLSSFLSAGFYYKTFMWPKAFWEKLYEPIIRAAAGLGSLSMEEDPDTYDKGYLHTDLLVIGAGPTGLAAALSAGRAGLRVIIADDDFLAGGRLNAEHMIVDGQASALWAATTYAELLSLPTVRCLSRTSVYGVFDHGTYGALQRCTDHLPGKNSDKPRQVLWRIYAKQTLLAAGATERPIAFPDNDRPAIMLAAAVRTYVNRFGVAPGKQVVIFTNNDDGWRTAADLSRAGVSIAALIDTRENPVLGRPVQGRPSLMDIPGARIITGGQIVATRGRLGIQSITLRDGQSIDCDCLAVSGGWSPNVHLTCHLRGRPQWREDIAAFVPGTELPRGMRVAGGASGSLGLADALNEGHQAALDALAHSGVKPTASQAPVADQESTRISAFWQVPDTKGRAWIDLQNDVTTKDIALSFKEGFRSVEHLKRYTTLGMATDQGKTSNVLGLAVMAQLSGQSIEQTGTTIFRPPYTPVPIGALAGRSRGKHFRPTRLTPSHQWGQDNGADFVETGMWMRAQWYTKPGETHWRQSVDREVLQTRGSVGICDVTTLGKIDIQGRDAAAFLDRVYANTFSTLAVGKVRYGLMLREDGFAMDDGTTARLADTHFMMTTTTANAVSVFRHLEFCRQCLWPEMDVHLISATEQWAQYAIAGPNARALLKTVVDAPFDISNEAFPFMACAELTVFNGTPARLFRISFSGEMAYELAVPARYGHALMQALVEHGKPFDAVVYGTEALGVMRIEKGHAAGNELNGQTTAANLGLGRMVSSKKDCIGAVLSKRAAMNTDDSIQLVGFMPEDTTRKLNAGAHFLQQGAEATLDNDQGWMSSVAYSPTLGSYIGLGFISRGAERLGESVIAHDPVRDDSYTVRIVSPHFVDPDGERLRG